MRIVSARSQRGVCLLGPRSALMLVVELDPWPALAQRPPEEAELASLWQALRSLGGEVSLFDEPAPRPHWGTLGDFRLDLLAELGRTLVGRYEVRPTQASVLERGESRFALAVACDEHEIGLLAWRHACESLAYLAARDRAVTGETVAALRSAATEGHQRLRVTARRLALNQLTLALAREAHRREIPWYRLGIGSEFVQFGQGRRSRRAHETVTDTTSALAASVGHDKALTNALLARAGLPTPGSRLCEDEQAAVLAAAEIGYPVVVKPRDGAKGRDVFVGLTDEAQVRDAWRRVAAGGASGVLVERLVPGDDHRLLVIGGRLVAAARRVPAFVVGDGHSSVRDLLASLNRDPRRGRGYERVMEKVDLDHEALTHLSRAGLSPDAVPSAGRRVALRGTANISRGGHADDVTDTIHPDNRELAVRAADAVGLDVAGIDFLSEDVARSWRENGAAVVEVNSNPGLRPHWVADEKRDVVGPLFERMFPAGAPSRVPTVAVAGAPGQTAVCRTIARALRAAGHCTGLSCSHGMFVDDETLEIGDRARGSHAVRLLSDPRVGAAVFELARAGLRAEGTVIDACDVGIVLARRSGDPGVDGVRTPQQLARLTGLVAEAATRAAVLDADDPFGTAVAARVRAPRVIWVGRDAGAAQVARQRAQHGSAVILDARGAARVACVLEGARTVTEIDLPAHAAEEDDSARAAAENALVAVAAAWALGIAPAAIREALTGFAPR